MHATNQRIKCCDGVVKIADARKRILAFVSGDIRQMQKMEQKSELASSEIR